MVFNQEEKKLILVEKTKVHLLTLVSKESQGEESIVSFETQTLVQELSSPLIIKELNNRGVLLIDKEVILVSKKPILAFLDELFQKSMYQGLEYLGYQQAKV